MPSAAVYIYKESLWLTKPQCIPLVLLLQALFVLYLKRDTMMSFRCIIFSLGVKIQPFNRERCHLREIEQLIYLLSLKYQFFPPPFTHLKFNFSQSFNFLHCWYWMFNICMVHWKPMNDDYLTILSIINILHDKIYAVSTHQIKTL